MCHGSLVSTQSEDFDQAVTWINGHVPLLKTPHVLHLAIAARVGAVFWTLDKRLEEALRWVGLTFRACSSQGPHPFQGGGKTGYFGLEQGCLAYVSVLFPSSSGMPASSLATRFFSSKS